jgi:sulfatase modifying factor 1
MGAWGGYESRAWMLGVCLWSVYPALTLAACGGRTALLDSDPNNFSTGGGVPVAGTSSSGGTSGGGTPSTGALGGGVPNIGGAGGSSAAGGGPCAEVCNMPPPAVCKTTAIATSYEATGTCSSGACSYAPTDRACGTNEQCAGAGVCSECKADSSCGATCAACRGETPKCKDLGATSQCVGCLSNADCGGATPICDMAVNVCRSPSCVGLAATCGPSGNGDCCASTVVTGVTTASFYRSYDGITPGYTSQAYPAQVSDFRLDTYEVTVGRFRKFVAAYSQTMIAAGAGANPNNASDTGWSTAWNASLDASSGALATALKCFRSYQTWTDAPGSAAAESLPINCIDWFEAEAFCIWDGGRLPTEAEWNYAAAGGTQQRVYPWGSAAPDCSYANFGATSSGIGFCVAPNGGLNRVGSESPKGDGLYGQADLAGNVTEWVQDGVSSYTTPCNNCSNLTNFPFRVLRGGSFSDDASSLLSSYRDLSDQAVHIFYRRGARCARTR